MNIEQQKVFTAETLNIMSTMLMSHLLTFSHWLIVGYGASVALLVANIKDVAEHIEPSVIAMVVRIFLAAAIFHLMQRYMYAVRTASIGVSDSVNRLAESHDLGGQSFDLNEFRKDIENSGIGPIRWLMKRQFKKEPPSSFNQAMKTARSTQFQGLLVASQFGCLCWGGYTIASALI